MNKLLTTGPLLILATALLAQPYKNAKLPAEARVKDLLTRMTVEEKAGQLNQLAGGQFTGPALNDAGQQAKLQLVREGKVGSFLNVIGAEETRGIQELAVRESRLGIPILFAYDVIHGYKTVFPIPLAEACSWNPEAIERNSSVAAREAAAGGIHWTFAPMCDISFDPRWGRVMEGAGEDPWWGAQVAAARVRGLQGNRIGSIDRVLACVKHFAAYGAVESGREYNHVDVSRVALWNTYMPPYEAAVKAGAATVMNAFNVFEGVPASGNKYLVTDILKKRWNYPGLVVSDWGSFAEMIAHGYAADGKDAALKAMQAGSDMDMESQVSVRYLPALVKEGKVTMAQLDDAVARVLRLKFQLGLFEDPYRFSNVQRERETLFTAAHRAQAREAARQSIVLLQNNGGALPLTNLRGRQVALIGALADSHDDLFDFWVAQGEAKDAVTLHEGLKAGIGGDANLRYAAGYSLDGKASETLVSEALALANSADVLIVNVGLSGKLAGEERSLAHPEIPANQLEMLRALRKTGKPLIAVVSSGRPLILTPLTELADAIVQAWILGTEHGSAITDVLTGAYNPDAKTVMTFPYAVGQIPVYYNHFNTGRPVIEGQDGGWKSRYRDIPNAPLYPFGFGLSYTSYAYSNLRLNKTMTGRNEPLTASVTVSNTGSRAGTEVVQLYIRAMSSSLVRPVKELKGFQRVTLQPGESKTISFTLRPEDLSYRDATGKLFLDPGIFKIMVGGNSRDVLTQELVVK